MNILDRLQSLQDPSYRAFQAALIPTVDPARILGVRIPLLRAYAREIRNTPEAAAFLQRLPHSTYDEDNLHAFLIEFIRDYDACVDALNRFFPHVDNWATCDSMNPRALIRHPDRLLAQIDLWLASEHTYAVRFGMGMLMRHFLDERFDSIFLDKVTAIRTEEYYINMMAAWYFATALAKQWDAVWPYLQNRRLSPWVHNKAIQKAIESRRISPQQKEILRKAKISR